MKTWQGRIETPTDPLFEAFTSSIDQDRRLAPYDVRVSRAHARALGQAGVLSERGVVHLEEGLDEIDAELRDGTFAWRDDLEDVHTHIESRLRDLVGPLADALHAGRSRNDQVAADLRLLVKDLCHAATDRILDVQGALLGQAEALGDAVMPGYTHLQQAQPVLIAHVLHAHVEALDRDRERFTAVLERTDRSPLGSGALTGSTFPLDRDLLAREAGFSRVSPNSLDAVGDRDFLAEFVGAAALCMAHLSRFAEDLILWSSVEFSVVTLPDGFASGSSMMPQKKNPDVAELIRGKAALTIGDAAAALALLKGLPSGYNRDLQEDKTPLYHAADTVLGSLQILAAMIPELRFNTARARSMISSFALATDLADHLVREGLAFRDAHAVVGGLVSDCLRRGVDLTDLSQAELLKASPRFEGMPALDVESSVRRKATAGGTHPDDVAKQVAAAQGRVERCRAGKVWTR